MNKSSPIDSFNFFCLLVFVFASQFSISVTQIALTLGVLTWLTKIQITRTWTTQQWPLATPILAYILACVIAVLTAYDIEYSFPSLKKLLLLLVFFWVLNSVDTLRKRDILVTLLIISSTLAALFGFYQSWEVGVLNTSNRVEGTFSTYMTFAGILMMVGLVAASRWIFHRCREHWLLLPVLIISVCLLLTLTRQAWLGFLIGSIYLIWNWRKLYLPGLAVLLITVILALPSKNSNSLPGAVKHRLHDMISGHDATFQIRTSLWEGGILIFKDHFLTGCGFRCVDLIHKSYPDPTGFVARFRGMHNNFVQLAVDTGLLGLAAWVWIWVAFLRQIHRKLTDPAISTEERWVLHATKRYVELPYCAP